MKPEIINKVLEKNATPEEARQVAKWFATAEGQAYLSKRYDREAYLLNDKNVTAELDHEVPSESMRARFIHKLKPKIFTFRFRFAAAILIPFLLLTGAFVYIVLRTGILINSEMAEVTVPYGEQMQVILQDGTKVQLNSGSHLQYPKSFGIFNRRVTLVGEGYFSVAKESTRPFLVNLDGVEVKVTGTKFNVHAYKDNASINITLEEGSVELIDKNNKTYPLKPNQNALYNRETANCSIGNISSFGEYAAWRNRSLNFYRTPLSEILKTMERQYDVSFVVKDSSLLVYKFSISTSKINTKDILNDLEKISKIRFKLTADSQYEVSSSK